MRKDRTQLNICVRKNRCERRRDSVRRERKCKGRVGELSYESSPHQRICWIASIGAESSLAVSSRLIRVRALTYSVVVWMQVLKENAEWGGKVETRKNQQINSLHDHGSRNETPTRLTQRMEKIFIDWYWLFDLFTRPFLLSKSAGHVVPTIPLLFFSTWTVDNLLYIYGGSWQCIYIYSIRMPDEHSYDQHDNNASWPFSHQLISH